MEPRAYLLAVGVSDEQIIICALEWLSREHPMSLGQAGIHALAMQEVSGLPYIRPSNPISITIREMGI